LYSKFVKELIGGKQGVADLESAVFVRLSQVSASALKTYTKYLGSFWAALSARR
jgi:hypothetical protein